MPIEWRLNQLRSDPDLVSRLHYGAFDYSIYIQLPRNLGDRFVHALVLHD
jgi:hypothetical protein